MSNAHQGAHQDAQHGAPQYAQHGAQLDLHQYALHDVQQTETEQEKVRAIFLFHADIMLTSCFGTVLTPCTPSANPKVLQRILVPKVARVR